MKIISFVDHSSSNQQKEHNFQPYIQSQKNYYNKQQQYVYESIETTVRVYIYDIINT